MQEGTRAFVQMVDDLPRASLRTRPPGCPTWSTCATRPPAACSPPGGRSGHVTVAEPGALVGFLGPRVYEALHGEPFPAGVQTAENLADKG